LTEEYVSSRIERVPSLGQSLINDLARATAMLPTNTPMRLPEERLIQAVRSLVCEEAHHGHVVVIGHGGVSLLGWRPNGVRVFAILLHASKAWRVEQLARRYGIHHDEAARRIERTDEARKRYQRHYFDSDMYDARQYDLVLNTERIGLDAAIRSTVASVRELADEPSPAESHRR
jgi:cytidylate kinase